MVEIHQTSHVIFWRGITLPETNSLLLKMDGWNTTFLLGFGLFSGAMLVFRGINHPKSLCDFPSLGEGPPENDFVPTMRLASFLRPDVRKVTFWGHWWVRGWKIA